MHLNLMQKSAQRDSPDSPLVLLIDQSGLVSLKKPPLHREAVAPIYLTNIFNNYI